MVGPSGLERPTRRAWQRWVRQPQKLWLRRALFQVHLWSGIALGLYVFFISVTGSVLVYRNELYVWAAPPDEEKVGLAYWLVGKLIELHDDLLSGPTGRAVNGVGATAVLLICLTGAVLWCAFLWFSRDGDENGGERGGGVCGERGF